MTSDERLAILLLAMLSVIALGLVTRSKFSREPFSLLGLLMALNRLYVKLWCRNRSNRFPLPGEGPAIVIANHISPLDPVLLQAATERPIGFMMAREFYEVRWFNWLYRRLGCIPVNRNGRDISSVKAALRALSRGKVIGIFPEGKINLSDEELLAPQLGAALLALRSQAPVVPAYISGVPLGHTLVKPFFQSCRARVQFGPPLDLSKHYGRKRSKELLEEVGQLMISSLAEIGGIEGRVEEMATAHGNAVAGLNTGLPQNC